MGFEDYWYVIEESEELTADRVISCRVLDETLACFRDADGVPTVLRDRCLHRNAPLSAGRVRNGLLSCSYHGWTYDGRGRVVSIPSMGESGEHCSLPFPATERDGYVYVRLKHDAPPDIMPFPMPHYGERGCYVYVRLKHHGPRDIRQFPMPHYGERGCKNMRLQNLFANDVAN